jgi:TolA-binding protein
VPEQKALNSIEMHEEAKRLNESGQKDKAKSMLREIIETHPDSEAAKISKTLLGWN